MMNQTNNPFMRADNHAFWQNSTFWLVLVSLLFLSACSAPLKAPVTISPNEMGKPPVAETNVASDTQLFLRTRQFLLQNNRPRMTILVMGGRILVYGPEASGVSASMAQRDLKQMSKARDVFWFDRPVMPEKTPAEAQALFEQRSAILNDLETRWSQDPQINSLNLRAGVDDDLTLYVLGFVTSDKERDAVINSLSYSTGIRGIVHRISVEMPRS